MVACSCEVLQDRTIDEGMRIDGQRYLLRLAPSEHFDCGDLIDVPVGGLVVLVDHDNFAASMLRGKSYESRSAFREETALLPREFVTNR